MRLGDLDALYEKFKNGKSDTEEEKDYNQVARYLIRQAPTIEPVRGEWISVDDRLPEEKGEYLVAFHPCYWDNVMEETMVGFDTFRGKTKWAKAKYQRVTHWMPLPEPPKEGEP